MNNVYKSTQFSGLTINNNPDIINNINYEEKEYTNDWLKH